MPGEEAIAHDAVLGALWPLPSIQSIKLVARLYDQRIGNEDAKTLTVLFPDMHLISRNKIGTRYMYGFNHESMYVAVVKALRSLSKGQQSFSISVIQLGDFVDLWKEKTDDPTAVFDQYQGVRDYLLNPKSRGGIDCRFALGNHDAEIALVPRLSSHWNLRWFIGSEDKPVICVTHGDVFDWLEKLPDYLQEWAVYNFSPKAVQPSSGLEEIRTIRRKQSVCFDANRTSQIGTPNQMQTGILEDRFRVDGGHKFLEKAFSHIQKINREHGQNINVVAIGHTHNAQLSVIEDRSRFFVLMDCGAWCGSYWAGLNDSKANCQMGVICGNDLRIYQLDANANVSPQFQKTAAT